MYGGSSCCNDLQHSARACARQVFVGFGVPVDCVLSQAACSRQFGLFVARCLRIASIGVVTLSALMLMQPTGDGRDESATRFGCHGDEDHQLDVGAVPPSQIGTFASAVLAPALLSSATTMSASSEQLASESPIVPHAWGRELLHGSGAGPTALQSPISSREPQPFGCGAICSDQPNGAPQCSGRVAPEREGPGMESTARQLPLPPPHPPARSCVGRCLQHPGA